MIIVFNDSKKILMPNIRITYIQNRKKTSYPLRAGFKPTRENPIGFQVERLNHSAIAAERSQCKKKN